MHGPASATRGPASIAEHIAACDGRNGWSDPAPPVRIHGNLYDVGTCGITVLLLAGDKGHVLIDAGPEAAVSIVTANIRRLGFDLADVKWILFSHEHFDHIGGLAELKRLTGAKVVARSPAVASLTSGEADPGDPQWGVLKGFRAVTVDRVVSDGEVIEIGKLSLVAHATPGHSPGSTSWTFAACDESDCRTVAYVDSLTAVSDRTYSFSAHPDYVAAFRRSLDAVGALPCGILVTPHPSASDLFERLHGKQPLADPQACAAFADQARQNLDVRLAGEAK